ncbi:MAG TPA: tRNA (guanosine(46)-N7)-methyltransferase TrmB [Candidatus Saccharimonadales bacterium]|jgi:tRNA (guanine-N7-)-methyltransferase
MPRRPKTPRFKQYSVLDNTFDNFSKNISFKGGPYVLEIGCGRGDFVLELAKRHSGQEHIGIDIKSDRMLYGASAAKDQKIANVKYLRADARDLGRIFDSGSISGIWLTFPDPYDKKRQAKHRLTHKEFMAIYANLLPPGGWLRLKTDSDSLFIWSKEEISRLKSWQITASGRNLHGAMPENSDWRIITKYEKKFIGEEQKINYLELARLN